LDPDIASQPSFRVSPPPVSQLDCPQGGDHPNIIISWLIIPYIIYDTISDCFSPCPCAALQVQFVSSAIRKARFKDNWRIGHASADTQRDRGNSSRLYEVNIWMWHYGGHPRMVSIAEAERIRAERLSKSRTRVTETRKRRNETTAALQLQRRRYKAAVERIEHWSMIS
jgi:hypothetical protein